MMLNAAVRLVVDAGKFDLVTPFFASFTSLWCSEDTVKVAAANFDCVRRTSKTSASR